MRFIPITAESPKIVALSKYSFPLPLVGRMILPREVEAAGSRMLLIDSDTCVIRATTAIRETDLHETEKPPSTILW